MTNYYQVILYLSILVVSAILIRDGYLKNFRHINKKIISMLNITHVLLLLILTVFFIFLIDKPLLQGLQKLDRPYVKTVFYFFNELGDGHNLFPLLFIFLLAAHLFKLHNLKHILAVSLLAALLGGLFGSLLKYIFLRSRPYVLNNPVDFFNWQKTYFNGNILAPHYQSFPSGHTINIFAVFTPFLLAIRKKIWTILLILPVLTALARIYYNKHWFSDVFAGALCSIYISSLIYYSSRRLIKN